MYCTLIHSTIIWITGQHKGRPSLWAERQVHAGDEASFMYTYKILMTFALQSSSYYYLLVILIELLHHLQVHAHDMVRVSLPDASHYYRQLPGECVELVPFIIIRLHAAD